MESKTMRAIAGLMMGALAFAAAAPAGATTVAQMLGRIEALKAKGMMALFSPDLKTIKAEMAGIGAAWRAQAGTARPPVCPPAKAAMDQDYVLKTLNAVPPAERGRTEVKDAFIRALNDRYRCR